MVQVTLMVENGDGVNDVEEYVTISLPGAPRVGETVVTEGALFEVRDVTWHDGWVSLRVYNTTYGYNFPVVRGHSSGSETSDQ